jgi:hypothetical protein
MTAMNFVIVLLILTVLALAGWRLQNALLY